MNDFGIDITGKTGVFNERSFYKPKATVAERTFVCLSGSGCSPQPGTGRKIEVKWKSDGLVETISTFAIECLLENGEQINPLPDAPPTDVYSVGDAPVKEAEPVQVRRKR